MARLRRAPGEKPIRWVGSSKNDLLRFPDSVKHEIGTALSVAQFGGKHPKAKPWHGQGPGIFEIVEDNRGDTYRAVYTVRFRNMVYVLHAFQKKSPSGLRTARRDVDLVARRLADARADFEVRYGQAES